LNKIYIGIDPGKSGAVAIINEDKSVQIFDTPTTKIETNQKTKSGNKKKKNLYLESEMVNLLKQFQGKNVHIALEKVHSMPGQGVSSMFSMGEGYGLWRGIMSAFQLSYTLITPQSWKKEMLHGLGKEKSISCYRAKQLFPNVELYTKNGRALDGRGDALLLAEYARRKNL